MDLVSALILGLIQGFTEWLPIPSSGHLVIAQALMKLDVPAAFDILIMIGTIGALLLYFRDRVLWLVFGLFGRDPRALRYIGLMVLAGLFTAIIGFPGKALFEGLFHQPFVVSLLIVVTGIFLLLVSKFSLPRPDALGPASAILIGIAQGIAVAPGISRSGSTIGTGMLLGVGPKEAAEFSFLVGVPSMIVASLFELKDAVAVGLDPVTMLVGIVAAFVAGYASIGFFMKILEAGNLKWFGYYCVIAGLAFAALTFG